jgi:hypothetical protein
MFKLCAITIAIVCTVSWEAAAQVRLGSTRNFCGATGTIEFEEGTRVEGPVELWTIENGIPVRLHTGCF